MTFNLPTDPAACAELMKRNLEFRARLQAKILGRVEAEHSEAFCKEVSAMLKQARADGIYPMP